MIGVGESAPGGELIDAHRVALDGTPGQVQSTRPALDRSDPVLPPIAGHEVAAGIADHGRPEPPDQLEDVAAETVLAGRRMPRLEDPGVDAPAHVFDEGAEQAAVDTADAESRIQRDLGNSHGSFVSCRLHRCKDLATDRIGGCAFACVTSPPMRASR
jgi:hypothetical protein